MIFRRTYIKTLKNTELFAVLLFSVFQFPREVLAEGSSVLL